MSDPYIKQKAQAWDALMEICGHWQDGSQERVTLFQDDATKTCVIRVGEKPKDKHYFKEGGSFELALLNYREHNPLPEDKEEL